MPFIEASCQPGNAARLTATLNGLAGEMNQLGRYHATAAGSRIDFTPIFTPVDFVHVSPTAVAQNAAAFLQFLRQEPASDLVNAYARASTVGRPSAESLENMAAWLADNGRTFPDKLQMLRNAFGDIHPYALPEVFEQIILPWYFGNYPNGRVIAVTLTEGADRSEFLRRNLVTLSLFGLEAYEADPARRKPYNDLLPTLVSRVQNVAKLTLQYNGPYLDGFCLEGVLTFFVFIPDESLHRRSIQTASLFDCLAPFSTAGAAPVIHQQDGHDDTVRAIHGGKASDEIEDWLRYWLARANTTLDRLYNLSRALDGAGRVVFDEYLRQILQFERIFFEVTWSCSMVDQFLRKILAYAVVDKVTSFMRDAPWCAAGTNPRSFGTQKYVAALTAPFIQNRLPALFQNPVLVANANAWLTTIHDEIVATARQYSFPDTLVAAGIVDWSSASPHLAACIGLPGNAAVVSEDVYSAQVIRAVRNTHHGFADLNPGAFAVLSTTSGVVSEELATLLPFLAFAMLDNPDDAIESRW